MAARSLSRSKRKVNSCEAWSAENSKRGIYSVFPFNPDSLDEYYHLAIIGKPGVPLIAASQNLAPDLYPSGEPPIESFGNYNL